MITEIIIVASGIFVFIALIVSGWGIHVFNYLTSGKLNVEQQWANVKAEYQRRYDMLPNLAEAVKSFKKHEAITYPKIAELRSSVNFKGDKAKTMKSMNSLDSFFSKLMMVNEKYPELKSKLHEDLLKEIRITEDRVNVARTDYNDVVREYNLAVKTFPSNIIAHIMRFGLETMYNSNEGTEKTPKIDLS